MNAKNYGYELTTTTTMQLMGAIITTDMLPAQSQHKKLRNTKRLGTYANVIRNRNAENEDPKEIESTGPHTGS